MLDNYWTLVHKLPVWWREFAAVGSLKLSLTFWASSIHEFRLYGIVIRFYDIVIIVVLLSVSWYYFHCCCSLLLISRCWLLPVCWWWLIVNSLSSHCSLCAAFVVNLVFGLVCNIICNNYVSCSDFFRYLIFVFVMIQAFRIYSNRIVSYWFCTGQSSTVQRVWV